MITERVEAVEDLVHKLNSLPNNFVYRGHAKESWILEPSLKRVFSADVPEEKLRKAESFSLHQFKSKFHLYDTTNKTPSTKLEWLSLMQHYGAPTRLLDFTESPFVALYFAIEAYDPRQNEDFAVYGLDYRTILKSSIDEIRREDPGFAYTYEDAQLKQDEIYETVIDCSPHEVLWVTEPTKVNLRLDRQAGCFMLSGDLTRTIEQVLERQTYQAVESYKFIIPREFYESIFALLRRMNITSKAIYGDLSGLAGGIRMMISAYR
jgi:hypothetical protein